MPAEKLSGLRATWEELNRHAVELPSSAALWQQLIDQHHVATARAVVHFLEATHACVPWADTGWHPFFDPLLARSDLLAHLGEADEPVRSALAHGLTLVGKLAAAALPETLLERVVEGFVASGGFDRREFARQRELWPSGQWEHALAAQLVELGPIHDELAAALAPHATPRQRVRIALMSDDSALPQLIALARQAAAPLLAVADDLLTASNPPMRPCLLLWLALCRTARHAERYDGYDRLLLPALAAAGAEEPPLLREALGHLSAARREVLLLTTPLPWTVLDACATAAVISRAVDVALETRARSEGTTVAMRRALCRLGAPALAQLEVRAEQAAPTGAPALAAVVAARLRRPPPSQTVGDAWSPLPVTLRRPLLEAWEQVEEDPDAVLPRAAVGAVLEALGPLPRLLDPLEIDAVAVHRPELAALLAQRGGNLVAPARTQLVAPHERAADRLQRLLELDAPPMVCLRQSRLVSQLREQPFTPEVEAVAHLPSAAAQWPGLTRRVALATSVVRRALPLWQARLPRDERCAAVLQELAHGSGTSAAAALDSLRADLASDALDDSRTDLARAVLALWQLATHGSVATDEPVELLIASVWQREASWAGNEPTARAREFWQWWLLEAVPAAWRCVV